MTKNETCCETDVIGIHVQRKRKYGTNCVVCLFTCCHCALLLVEAGRVSEGIKADMKMKLLLCSSAVPCGWVFSLMVRLLNSVEADPRMNWVGGNVDPTTGLTAAEKISVPAGNRAASPDRLTCRFTTLVELRRLKWMLWAHVKCCSSRRYKSY
jgi:hypothetical protein